MSKNLITKFTEKRKWDKELISNRAGKGKRDKAVIPLGGKPV